MNVIPDARWADAVDGLRAVVRRRGVALDDVDDVVQSAIERALRRIHMLEQPDRFDAWLKQIAANAAIDQLRGAQRRAPEDDWAEAANVPAGHDPIDPLLSFADCIAPMLHLLRPADSDAVRLKDLDGLSFADLAAMWSVSVPGAKSRVQRARRRLAEALIGCCASLAKHPRDVAAEAPCEPPFAAD
ncbi:MAG: sigma-70 family RNA polymerase sigma factor [Pseudomonadota bacterium]